MAKEINRLSVKEVAKKVKGKKVHYMYQGKEINTENYSAYLICPGTGKEIAGEYYVSISLPYEAVKEFVRDLKGTLNRSFNATTIAETANVLGMSKEKASEWLWTAIYYGLMERQGGMFAY